MWVPFGLVGECISRPCQETFHENDTKEAPASVHYQLPSTKKRLYVPSQLGSILPTRIPRDDEQLHPGSVLGIHNMYVVLPQFVMTLISSVVFAVLERQGGSKDDPGAIGFVLRCGGVMALVAGIYSRKLLTIIKRPQVH
jgi:solute carrier family 45 protein 1/2/4